MTVPRTQLHPTAFTAKNQVPAGTAPSAGTPTLLFTSGRGGSGTTLLSVLASLNAAAEGKRVLLIDTDETTGTISILLGLRAEFTWPELRTRHEPLASVITPVSTHLSIIAGGSGDAALMNTAERRAMMRRLIPLGRNYDLVVIDCGSRLDTVASVIQPHAAERVIAVMNGADPVTLAATYALFKVLRQRHPSLEPSILVNRLMESDAERAFRMLEAGSGEFLDASPVLAGIIPEDTTLNQAVRAGIPFREAVMGSPAAVAVHLAVASVTSTESPSTSYAGI